MTDDLGPDDEPIDAAGTDDLLDALAALDPTAADAPPAPGTTRYLSILEHAMTRTTDAEPVAPPTVDHAATRTNRRRLAFALAAVAAAVVVAAIVVVAPGSDGTRASAAEAVAAAAEATGEVRTLRAEATYERPEGTNRVRVEANGANYRIDSMSIAPDGGEERETTVVIGDTVWEDGGKRTAPPEERNAAFAPSSEAVVEAVLDGSTLEDLGDEDVRDVSARHIRATLTGRSRAALSRLSPSQVAMFELENTSGVDTLDLWIADDLIRRIRMTVDEGTAADGTIHRNRVNIEFFDFGAPITIRPPA